MTTETLGKIRQKQKMFIQKYIYVKTKLYLFYNLLFIQPNFVAYDNFFIEFILSMENCILVFIFRFQLLIIIIHFVQKTLK